MHVPFIMWTVTTGSNLLLLLMRNQLLGSHNNRFSHLIMVWKAHKRRSESRPAFLKKGRRPHVSSRDHWKLIDLTWKAILSIYSLGSEIKGKCIKRNLTIQTPSSHLNDNFYNLLKKQSLNYGNLAILMITPSCTPSQTDSTDLNTCVLHFSVLWKVQWNFPFTMRVDS